MLILFLEFLVVIADDTNAVIPLFIAFNHQVFHDHPVVVTCLGYAMVIDSGNEDAHAIRVSRPID